MTHADLRSGKDSTAWLSASLRAIVRISCRLSRKIAASSAFTNSSIAAFHDTLAAFRCLEPLSRLASCESRSVWSDASRKKSIGSGMDTPRPQLDLGERIITAR